MGIAYEPKRETVLLFSILCWQAFIRLLKYDLCKFTLTGRKILDEFITKFLTDKILFANSKPSLNFALFWQWQLLLCCQTRVMSF